MKLIAEGTIRLRIGVARRLTMHLVVLLIVVLCRLANAQQTQSDTGSPTGAASTNGTSPSQSEDSSGIGVLTSVSSENSLSAAQIISILQDKPEVVVELKSYAADQLQQQGIDTNADSITDEMLYSQISSNADLRKNITLWLRGRGYISDVNSGRSIAGGDNDSSFLPPQNSNVLVQQPGAGSPASGSLLGLGSQGMKPTDSSQLAGTAGLDRRPRNVTQKREPNITDDPEVLRLPAPYNLSSLRDLYTQVPEDDAKLKRFGSDVFLDRSALTSGRASFGLGNVPIDLPVGPDYVLGTGDGLTINLSGGMAQSLNRVIDREGKIVLPESRSLVVAGLTLQQAQTAIEDAIQQQFRNEKVDLTIARLRTVRVYVVGDVQRPGAYDVNSLSTPLNALYAAGGPTSIGSLRTVRHLRGKQLIREVDLYDFLLHGIRMDDERLQSGDTLLVPPAGPQVGISGMVKRPAIYELRSGANLAEALEDAGGTTVAAQLNQITINRIQENQHRETVTLSVPPSATLQAASQVFTSFLVKDGDRIRVAPILPYSESSVYMQGHVVRPGKYAYHDGMQLNDLVKSYQDLLPEPAAKGEIIRLVPPDLHPETVQFNVADILIGNNGIALQPFDTIRVFGRYEVDSPQVTIKGEVLRPGTYAFPQGMTASQLVKMAGGFKRDALLETADLTSYTVQDEKKIVSQRSTVSIGAAVKDLHSGEDVPLKPGDVLTIHQISGWNDIGASVSLEGEITYPGSYGLQEGERLSSVLRRAGGLRSTAYSAGAVLVRTQVRELEEKSRAELIRQIETTSASARLGSNLTSQDQTATLQAAAQQQSEVLQHLRSQPASGRLVIRISADISSWADTPADIEMRSGDVLTVPKRPGFVLISGQVYNASAITFVPGKNAGWYLRRAGGTNDVANRKEIFVVRANGVVVGRRSGEWYESNVLSTRLDPGDVVVVPQKIVGGSLFWRNLLTVAQLASSIAITGAVAGIF
jgi:protein involved in polysaccharide export with SLBB domain